MGERVGDVGDQRRGFGVDLAALEAEAAVDAVRPVAEAAVGDGDGTGFGDDAERAGAAQEDLAVAACGVRAVRVGMRVAPRPALAGDGELGFDVVVVGLQVVVAEGPVGAGAVAGEGFEVAGVQPRGIAGVVDHRPADAAAGVVRAERHRVVAGDDARLGPVQVVRAGLVANPVLVRVPERAGVQGGDAPAAARQPLRERGAARATANDDQVELVGVGEAAHPGAQAVVGAGAVVGEQPGRGVARSYGCHWVDFTGSSPGRVSGSSNGSRRSMPVFLYPRG